MRASLVAVLGVAAVLGGCGVVQVRGLGSTGNGGSGGSNGPSGAPAHAAAANGGSANDDQAEEAAKLVTRAWYDVAHKHENDFELLAIAAGPNLGTDPSGQSSDHAVELLGRKAELAEIAAACKEGKYRGERNGWGSREQYLAADAMCPLLGRHEELIKKAIHGYAMSHAEAVLKDRASSVESFEKDGLLHIDIAVKGWDAQLASDHEYLDSHVKKHFDAIGEAVPEELHAKVTAIQERLKAAALARVDKTVAEPRQGNDGAAERAITAANVAHNLVVKRAWMINAEWQIEQGQYGNIVTRYKNGRVLAQVKGAPYCLLIRSTAFEKYAGGGTYSQTIDSNPDMVGEPAKCR